MSPQAWPPLVLPQGTTLAPACFSHWTSISKDLRGEPRRVWWVLHSWGLGCACHLPNHGEVHGWQDVKHQKQSLCSCKLITLSADFKVIAAGRQLETPRLAGLFDSSWAAEHTQLKVSLELLKPAIILYKATYNSFREFSVTSLLKILIAIRINS